MRITITRNAVIALTLCFAIFSCNRFHTNMLLHGIVGYDVDECEKRRITHHAATYADGTNPGRARIWIREFRCRIERICVGKSEEENEKCKQDARRYWGFYDKDKKAWESFKSFDDEWDAACTLTPYRCSPKFRPQENYSTNPYWNKETKSYSLPEKRKK